MQHEDVAVILSDNLIGHLYGVCSRKDFLMVSFCPGRLSGSSANLRETCWHRIFPVHTDRELQSLIFVSGESHLVSSPARLSPSENYFGEGMSALAVMLFQ